MKNHIEKLQNGLKRRKEVVTSMASLNTLETELQGERARLIRTGRLDDKEAVTIATNLSTRIEMIPFRRQDLGEKLEAIDNEISQASKEAKDVLLDALQNAEKLVLARLRKAVVDLGVSGNMPDGTPKADFAVGRVYYLTDASIWVREVNNQLSVSDSSAENRAECLLGAFENFTQHQTKFAGESK